MPLDMTETTLSVPRYIKDYVKTLADTQTQDKGRYVSQKEIVTALITREFKKTKAKA